ncbi:MAG: ProQ/FinO family protein [Candidatus Competibacteraceae bacterium]
MSIPVNSIIDRLHAAFPACFNRTAPQPLKIGLSEELLAQAGVHPALADLSRTQLRRALRVYTTAPAYRAALAQGGPRYDLDGQPAGEVTPEQQALARVHPKTPLPGPEPSPVPGFLKMTLKRRVRPGAGE